MVVVVDSVVSDGPVDGTPGIDVLGRVGIVNGIDPPGRVGNVNGIEPPGFDPCS